MIATPVVAVNTGRSDAARYADHVLELPETHPRAATVLASVQLQLAAYHVANKLGRSIDKPRNLTESVPIESGSTERWAVCGEWCGLRRRWRGSGR